MLEPVGRQQGRHPAPAQKLHKQQADRAAADHSRASRVVGAGTLKGIECNGQRLGHGEPIEAYLPASGDEKFGGPREILSQRAVGRRIAKETHFGTDVGLPGAAPAALPARMGRVDGHARTDRQVGNAIAHSRHLTGGFVAQDQTGCLGRVDLAVGCDVMSVGPTQAHRANLHQRVTRGGGGDRLVEDVEPSRR